MNYSGLQLHGVQTIRRGAQLCAPTVYLIQMKIAIVVFAYLKVRH